MKDFIEIERKYIIEMPKDDLLSSLPCQKRSSIVQIYLASHDGVTRRIRSRKYESGIRYFETVKRRIDKISAYEDEKEISKSEFNEKSKEIKEGTTPIIKDRIEFSYSGKVFEIDIYPAWSNTAIMEVELNSAEEEVKIPDFIKIIKEVTGERKYSNAAMSENFPAEVK